MWDHFLSMTNNNNSDKSSTTIVITTHYIEEARQAHRVGMMRFGKLLAEDSPDNLIKR
jgi:ABC-type multidrug transport system ATPase subunit